MLPTFDDKNKTSGRLQGCSILVGTCFDVCTRCAMFYPLYVQFTSYRFVNDMNIRLQEVYGQTLLVASLF